MCKRQGSLTGLASPNTDSSDDKPQEARGVGIRTKHKSKLRIGGQIATGNPSPCPLDGDFAPHTRIIRIADAVGSLRSQQSAGRFEKGVMNGKKRSKTDETSYNTDG